MAFVKKTSNIILVVPYCFSVAAKLLIAEIQWYRGPYSGGGAGGGEGPPPDLNQSRVSAMAGILEVQPKDDIIKAMVLLGRVNYKLLY